MKDRIVKMKLTTEERDWIKAWRAARACAGKRRFPTHRDAVNFAVFSTGLTALSRPYLCPECAEWHLTDRRRPRRNPHPKHNNNHTEPCN